MIIHHQNPLGVIRFKTQDIKSICYCLHINSITPLFHLSVILYIYFVWCFILYHLVIFIIH